MAVSCPRCGGPVRPPDLMHTEWRCDRCGPVAPFHVAKHVDQEILETAVEVAGRRPGRMPLWCPWPLHPGWVVTGVGWAGDERTGVRATALAASGPAPLDRGPADLVLIAEQPGVGLGTRFAGISGPDPGPVVAEQMASRTPAVKIRVGGHSTALWPVLSDSERTAFAGEAMGNWLYAVTWPPSAGYLFADELAVQDLTEWLPPELVFGAPSPYLHGRA